MATSRIRPLQSSIGTKLLIGATGLFLFIYLIIHIAGNLVVFLGPEAFNHYAHTLASNPLIKVVEIVLLLGFAIHIVQTVGMYLANRKARPVGYAKQRYAGAPSRKTLASSTMIISGLWLLVFLVIHVKAFRFTPMYEYSDGVPDLYRLEMDNFRNPLVVAFYVISMVLVGSHLWHGVGSGFQSLGADDSRVTPWLLKGGKFAAVAIAGGFIVITLWAHFVGGGQP
jgi:succinate dehydrogenase / fumarate reductase, cytochrome b subunit